MLHYTKIIIIYFGVVIVLDVKLSKIDEEEKVLHDKVYEYYLNS